MQQSQPIQEQVRQAATGNLEALTGLVLEYAPGLRLMLAAQVESFAAIAPLELGIWVTAQSQLGDYDATQPFSEWLSALAHEPLIQHLQTVLVRSLAVQDAATARLAQDSLGSVSDGSETGVLKLAALRDALPETTRTLLTARYRNRQPASVIADRQGTDVPTIANALVAARARCDWRGVAKPPAAGDRDLPPIIEDLLSGIIDNASRGVMADYLARDPAYAQQMARQIHVHVALRVVFMPFTQAHATVMARQVLAGGTTAGRVVVSAPVRIPVVPRSVGNETVRMPRPQPDLPGTRGADSSSRLVNTRARVDDESDEPLAKKKPASRRVSPLPYVVVGALVLGGIIGLLMVNRSGSTPAAPPTPVAWTEPPMPLPPPENQDPVVADTPVPAETNAALPLPTPPSQPADGPLQVTLVGVVADSHSYAGRELTLRSVLSSDAGIARVEYWNGDAKLGEATTVPWTFSWTPTAGAWSLSARVVTQSGDTIASAVIPFRVVTTYGSGSLRREWWTGIRGEQLKDLDKIEGFPSKPQGDATVDRFAAPGNWGDSYVQRVWGFVIPPLDGDYVFWIAADDEGELWLSTDDSAQTRQRIAVSRSVPGSGTKLMEWDRQPGQRSEPVRLQAGRRYLIEALHKEGGGSDHVEVGWRLPDGSLERPIPGIHLSPPPESAPTKPIPPPTTVVVVPPPVPTYTVVRALNLGGETVEIDDVTWLGQRQAEAEGETPANSHQPGPWLSDLEWTSANNGNGPVRRDRSTTERPLTIDGKVYAKGLGVHSKSEVVYALDGRWSGFTALVGIDSAADAAKAEVVFQVWLDGQRVWDSGAMRKGNGAKAVAVPLAGRKEMRLVVDESGANDWDHANWADARFMRPGGDDGMLQVKTGKRSAASYTPKPAVDTKMRSLLTTALSGTSKDGLEFDVRVPNGPLRVWLLVGESSTTNSRQFELNVDGTILPPMTGMPSGSWQKIGPVDLLVTDETVTVTATPIKGTPQLMGFLAERPENP